MNIQAVMGSMVLLGFWLLMGCLNIWTGLTIKKRGLAEGPAYIEYGTEEYWRKQQQKWGIEDEDHALIEQLMYCWGQIYYRGQLYSGIALIATICLYIVYLLFTAISPVGAWPYWLGFLLSFLLGQGIGCIVGVYQMRAVASHQHRYGDLRPRTLANYRSLPLFLLPILLIVTIFVATALFAPSMGSIVNVPTLGKVVLLSNTSWSIWVGPSILLVIFVAAEWVMRRIADLPRLLVIDEPEVARRADELLRTKVLTILQGMELYSLAFVSYIQWNILITGKDWLHTPLLIIALVLTLVVGVVGMMYVLWRERVAGRGWSWQVLRGVE